MRERPPVTVYVTREHPETGVEEFLVFDFPGDPKYEAIVPGGGIDEGETIAETAVREVKEETGLDVDFVRVVGTIEGAHYVQTAPIGPTPETWTHLRPEDDEVVVCRWLPVSADVEVWGLCGELVHALEERGKRRLQVIVYVTRENPETGADELLVFDVPARPEFSAVVPGGGIDEGESLEEAALREVREETGLEVEFVRELGIAENPGQLEPSFVHVAHYVQTTPLRVLPETWDHRVTGEGEESGALVVCRWLPVSADVEVWGLRGAFVHALVRKRVSVYVTRERDGRTELLVFDHQGMPEVVTQVPAGRVDAHETLEEGALREVEEETGLQVEIRGALASPEEHDLVHGVDAHKTTAFHATATADGPDSWAHPVTGTGMDVGLVYECRWVPIDNCPPLWGDTDPLVEKLRRSITGV